MDRGKWFEYFLTYVTRLKVFEPFAVLVLGGVVGVVGMLFILISSPEVRRDIGQRVQQVEQVAQQVGQTAQEVASRVFPFVQRRAVDRRETPVPVETPTV